MKFARWEVKRYKIDPLVKYVRPEYFKVRVKGEEYYWVPITQMAFKLSRLERIFLSTHEELGPNDPIKWTSFYVPITLYKFRDNNQVSSLVFFLTPRCNLRCTYCYGRGGEIDLPDLTEEEIHVMLKTFPSVKHVTFHGWGEPTLKLELIKNILRRYGRRYNWSIGTNGVYYDRREEVAKMLKQYNVKVTLSMDSIPEINDRQRLDMKGQGSSKEVINTIETFQQYNINFGLRSTVSKGSLPYLKPWVDWLYEHGIYRIKLEPLWVAGRTSCKDEYSTPPDLMVFGKELVDTYLYGRKKGVLVTSTFLPFAYRTRFCSATKSTSLVLYNNKYIGTCWEEMIDIDSPFVIGKMSKYGSKYKVELFKDKIERLKTRDQIHMFSSKCEQCPVKYSCAGGCPYKSWKYNNRSLDVPGENREACNSRVYILKLLIDRAFNTTRGKDTH